MDGWLVGAFVLSLGSTPRRGCIWLTMQETTVGGTIKHEQRLCAALGQGGNLWPFTRITLGALQEEPWTGLKCKIRGGREGSLAGEQKRGAFSDTQ